MPISDSNVSFSESNDYKGILVIIAPKCGLESVIVCHKTNCVFEPRFARVRLKSVKGRPMWVTFYYKSVTFVLQFVSSGNTGALLCICDVSFKMFWINTFHSVIYTGLSLAHKKVY